MLLVTTASFYGAERNRVANANRAKFKAKCNDAKTGRTYVYRLLRKPMLPGATCIQDSCGQLTAEPDAIDQVMRDNWAPIYEGNNATREHTAKSIAKYMQFCAHGPTIQVPDLDEPAATKALRGLGDSAGGRGRLAAIGTPTRATYRHYSPDSVTDMVECNKPWPEALTMAKCAYTGKCTDVTVGALKFRGFADHI